MKEFFFGLNEFDPFSRRRSESLAPPDWRLSKQAKGPFFCAPLDSFCLDKQQLMAYFDDRAECVFFEERGSPSFFASQRCETPRHSLSHSFGAPPNRTSAAPFSDSIGSHSPPVSSFSPNAPVGAAILSNHSCHFLGFFPQMN